MQVQTSPRGAGDRRMNTGGRVNLYIVKLRLNCRCYNAFSVKSVWRVYFNKECINLFRNLINFDEI